MSQRDSGYERKGLDLYETPAWVTIALTAHLPEWVGRVWEPAAGGNKMARALEQCGYKVWATDIQGGIDFLEHSCVIDFDAIITNPPYGQALAFIEHALELVAPGGLVAMLLRTDYDHAKTRQHLFAGCKAFSKKIVLTRRIRWFEDSTGAPSFNHAWFVWDHGHSGPPVLAYGP